MRVLILLAVVGCSHSNKDATPAGAKVIEWTAAKSSRPAFQTATFEGATPKDATITVKVCADDVKLALHVVSGTAKYKEADQAMAMIAPSEVTATVVDGKDFTFGSGKCDGPNYELTAPGTPPKFTILDCHLHATKPNNDCAPMFQLKGDGTVM